MDFSLVLVTLAAFATPMILSRFKIGILPTSVAEIIVGIILGKSALDIVHTGPLLSYASTFGVLLLMFLSGMEIDFSLFKKSAGPQTPLAKKKANQEPTVSPLKAAVGAYILATVTAVILALVFHVTGLFSDIGLATILFMTVSLGIVISLLKENELLSRPFGQAILLFSVLGEVVPMLLLTLYSSLVAGDGASIWLISILFIVAAFLFRKFRSFFTFFDTINKSTTQLDIRLAIFVIIMLVWMAEKVGAENILGAFVAGIVFKLLQPAEDTEQRLDSIGYGFLIPFFFIMTGVKLDIPALLTSPTTLVLIPLFFLAYVLAKLPAYLALRKYFSSKNALAGSFLASTTITLVLATLTVAEELKVVTAQQSGAFLLAGLLTCIISPLLFNKLYRPEPTDKKKTKVHFIGANLVTISAAQQLTQSWYEVDLYTDSQKNYTTYDSEANVHLLTRMDKATAIASGAFDTDILVLGHVNFDINYQLALAAKEYGVERVIARLDNPDPVINSQQEAECEKQGIEYYSSFDTRVGMMRSMIESPSIMQILTSGDARLYELTVNNAKFDGLELYKLPFIEGITISRIFRNHKSIAPHGSTRIQLGDHIVFSGSRELVSQVRATLEKLNE